MIESGWMPEEDMMDYGILNRWSQASRFVLLTIRIQTRGLRLNIQSELQVDLTLSNFALTSFVL